MKPKPGVRYLLGACSFCICSCMEEQDKGPPPRKEPESMISFQTKDPSERCKAARALGVPGNSMAVPVLIGLLEDPNQDVRSSAAWALGRIGDAKAIGPLIDSLVKHEAIRDDYFRRETRCMTDIYVALEELTGQELGLDVQKWTDWWKRQQKRE